jgi:hypothetical protein
LKDISKLSKLGVEQYFLLMFNSCSSYYWFSFANLIKPGKYINEESRQSLIENFSTDASQKIELAVKAKNSGPLQL